MSPSIKERLIKYGITLAVMAVFLPMAKDAPHAGPVPYVMLGWSLILFMACVLGVLRLKWYWNIVVGLVLTTATLPLSILLLTPIAKALPGSAGNLVFAIIGSLMVIAVFAVLAEIINLLARKMVLRNAEPVATEAEQDAVI